MGMCFLHGSEVLLLVGAMANGIWAWVAEWEDAAIHCLHIPAVDLHALGHISFPMGSISFTCVFLSSWTTPTDLTLHLL